MFPFDDVVMGKETVNRLVGSVHLKKKRGIIGSCNGLVPIRHQAITSTTDDPVQWRIYRYTGLIESGVKSFTTH